jgi:hypothetical protein
VTEALSILRASLTRIRRVGAEAQPRSILFGPNHDAVVRKKEFNLAYFAWAVSVRSDRNSPILSSYDHSPAQVHVVEPFAFDQWAVSRTATESPNSGGRGCWSRQVLTHFREAFAVLLYKEIQACSCHHNVQYYVAYFARLGTSQQQPQQCGSNLTQQYSTSTYMYCARMYCTISECTIGITS